MDEADENALAGCLCIILIIVYLLVANLLKVNGSDLFTSIIWPLYPLYYIMYGLCYALYYILLFFLGIIIFIFVLIAELFK